MKRLLLLLIVLAMPVALVVGCSSSGGSGPDDDNDTPVESSIGPAGGSIEFDGFARLDVPAGALDVTVDFTMEENDSPSVPPQGKDFCSDCVSIEPSGTNFNVPATVTVEYDPGELEGADEADVVVYTDDGRGWAALPTTVDEGDNRASAPVDHLSDFAAMVDTTGGGNPADGVFAALRLARGVTYMEFARRESVVIQVDYLQAWFDETVAPCAPCSPIRVDTVWCENAEIYPLEWSEPGTLYQYISIAYPQDFLEEGETYTFHVGGGDDAPDLTASIDFVDSTPYMIAPVNQQIVSLSGFTVTWEGHEGPGNVYLSVLHTGHMEDGVYVETPNDGSHTFTAGDLSELVPGQGAITLNYINREAIDEPGFDSESYIQAQVSHGILVVYQ